MSLVVQKYGGTSVGSLERIIAITETIIKTRNAGHDVIVVVSAMGHETDKLITMARDIQAQPDPREYSVLVSTGEQVSMALVAMALMAKNCEARSYTGWQVKIKTNNIHSKARILDIDTDSIKNDLKEGRVVVVAGFQGVDEDGNITTLGRGGSDTSAVALAAALHADECQIYTDVDGVYTTDPRMVDGARCLEQLAFEEMLELTSLGAKVLQNRAVEYAARYKVPLRVLSSFEEGPGTLITDEGKTMEKPLVSGIAFNRNEATITLKNIPDEPGIAYLILGAISKANIDVDMIVKNIAHNDKTDFTFTVSRDDYKHAMDIASDISTQLKAGDVVGDNRIGKISLVGIGMRSHAGVASMMFNTLTKEGINIMLVTTSEIKISVVVAERYLELGVRSLHAAFNLDKEELATEEFDPKL